MICLLGSSFTRGAQGVHEGDHSTYIHNMLSEELDEEVVNLSMSGHGSESYCDAYVYACRRFRPRLFLAEVFKDRTFCHLWLPTKHSAELAQKNPQQIYDSRFAVGLNDGQAYDFKNLWGTKIFRQDTVDQGTRELYGTSEVQHHRIEHLLSMYEQISVYMEHEWSLRIRTLRQLVALEELSQLVGVPVLWYTFLDEPMFRPFTDMLPRERHLNSWAGIPHGTSEWAAERFQGDHIADVWHLNAKADRAVIKELTALFIRSYLNDLAENQQKG